MDVTTARLVLHPFTAEEARRVVEGAPSASDRWAPGYPLVDELDPLRHFVERLGAGSDEHPFTLYRIDELATGLAVGGIGFFYPPDDEGTTELGYGLIPDARGKGYATEAVRAALDVARAAGAVRVIADTELGNVASQGVLTKAGFVETMRADELVFFAMAL